jgi:RsiW-degrading membrane proteinase PrsW (M82 family)
LALFVGFSLLAARAGSGLPVYAAIITGAFVGPVVYVVYLAESHLLPERKRDVVIAFLLAAGLGIPLAIYMEILVGARPGALERSVLVALIEETAKLVGVAWIMRRATARFQMDGLVYGAAAGMGFAAFETVMYGFYRINSVDTVLATLWVRSLLSPFGHGTWTAIICGAIWRHKAAARRDVRVLLAFGIAVLLHTLWDWLPVQGILLLVWFVVIGGVGLVVLREMLDAATREAAQAVVALNPEVLGGRSGAVEAACHVCGQVAPPGTHYCARCGAVLRGRVSGT